MSISAQSRVAQTLAIASLFLFIAANLSIAAPGDWPEPRQNPHLTTIQPLPGEMVDPPSILSGVAISPSRPSMRSVPSPDGTETWGLCIVGGALHCFSTSGQEIWRSHPPGLNFTSIEAAEDLDLDGRVEIALKAGRTADPYSAAVLVSLENGSLLWSYDVEPMSYAWYLHVVDVFPEKQSKQVIVLMQGYPPDAQNGYITLFDFIEPGRPPVQQWRYAFHDYTAFPTLLLTDLDNDGTDELAIETHSRMWLLDARTGAVKQFIGWDPSPGNVRSYGLIKFVDLDPNGGDGLEDFLCIANFSHHQEVLLNDGGRLALAWVHGWPDETATQKIVSTWPEPPHADVDGNGRIEILASMYNSENENQWLVRVYDALTGELIYRRPGAVAFAVYDLDKDNKAEVAVNLSTDPTQTVWTGAQLLKIENGDFQVLWQDASATFIQPTSPPESTSHYLRFERGGQKFALIYDVASGITEVPSPDIPVAGPDFSKVPSIAASQYPTLLAADLTGDGRNEILVYSTPTLRVFTIRDDGSSEEIAQYQSSGLPAIADLDGDGYSEIITGQVSMTQTPVIEARTPALGDRLLWRSVFPNPSFSGLPWTMKPFYVRPGRFTGKSTPDLYVWAGVPLVRSTVVDGLTGQIVWEKSETSVGRYWGPTHQPAAVYDYLADGFEDLIVTIPDYYGIISGQNGKFLRGPSFPPTIFNQPSQGLYTLTAILEEASGDPTVCLVGGHYFQGAMSITARRKWYKLPVVGESRYAAEGFLRTENGEWLLGVGRQNGNFGCINVADGTLRWEFNAQASIAETCTMDVDGDGRFEFILATSHSRLIALGDDSGSPRIVWEADLPAGAGYASYPAAQFAPIAADMNADGKSEIVVPCYDGYVYVFGKSGAFVENSVRY